MSGVFPKGPIGFKVYGIGWVSGNPVVHALVAMKYGQEMMEFNRKLGVWFYEGKKLDDEEQEMLKKVWSEECTKKGLPSEPC